MNQTFYQPLALGPDPVRLRVEPPPCAATSTLQIEGIAQLATNKTLKQRRPRREYVSVGSHTLQLSHEHEPGWPIALRLVPGTRYSVEVFECLHQVESSQELPLDAASEGGLVFFSIARPLRKHRDPFDHRRSLQGYSGVWTDGLMVRSANAGDAAVLKPGTAYKVVVRCVGQPS